MREALPPYLDTNGPDAGFVLQMPVQVFRGLPCATIDRSIQKRGTHFKGPRYGVTFKDAAFFHTSRVKKPDTGSIDGGWGAESNI